MISTNWSVLGFFIFCLVSSVTSLKCYVCDERENKNCRRYLNAEMAQECHAIPDAVGMIKYPSGCATLISRNVIYNANPETNVKRGCFYGSLNEAASLVSHDEGCVESPGSAFTPYRCKSCAEDLCNSTPISGSSIINPLSLITISYLILLVKFFM